MLPAYAVVHLWLGKAKEALLFALQIKVVDSVLWPCILWLGKRYGPKCPAGKVKVSFCLDATTCITGESV